MNASDSTAPADSDLSLTTRTKRRKLKHPRTSRACMFCRRRKVRCSGNQPCDYCINEEVQCVYDDGISRTRIASPQDSGTTPRHTGFRQTSSAAPGEVADDVTTLGEQLYENRQPGNPRAQSSRAPVPESLEPPQTFVEGHHIGPTAGVSFLYHVWNRSDGSEGEAALPSAPLVSHGDVPLRSFPRDTPLPTRDEANTLLERYFRFATPTYRFLHRPTLETWASKLLNGETLSTAEAACALIAFSQSLLYARQGNCYMEGKDEALNRSISYFEKASSLLNQEPGPATLTSVQARLAKCLFLLSTFRINECRFCFSSVYTILTTLGLHRQAASKGRKLALVKIELRKRILWAAYVLDDYLSIMLGRPRMIRDEDIDQPYPRNIDDQDLLSSEAPEDLPLHGNLEGFIAHADLAKLMGRGSDLIYPLQPLTEEEIFERTNHMLASVARWRDNLPDFLKPREKTLTGGRTFERQNTILKFAYAHLQILITRRCLLTDFGRLGRGGGSVTDRRALTPIQECVNAINTILNMCYEMSTQGAMYQGFWFTQYAVLVALSTLYIFIIQTSRSNPPPGLFPNVDKTFEKAKYCQETLTTLAPEGSQANRHLRLLDRLRLRAEKDAERSRRGNQKISGVDIEPAQHAPQDAVSITHSMAAPSDAQASTYQAHGSLGTPTLQEARDPTQQPEALSNGTPATIGQFTPSEEDVMFQSLHGWGWESLDTVGFPGDGDLFGFNYEPRNE